MSARALEFIVPGDLESATGGYVYDRRMITGLRALGWQVTVHRLDESFPQPSAAALEHAHRVFATLREHALVLIDGLAFGAMPDVVESHSLRLELLALIHLPLAAEPGLASRLAQGLEESERQALRAVRHVIVTSRSTQEMLRVTYGIARERVSVVEPGTDVAPLVRGRCDDTVRMLCVATVNPGKGHDLLIDALAPLASLNWHLTCVGSLTRSPETVERLRTQLRHRGLSERVTLVGAMDTAALGPHFLGADLFVLPTRFETYGMAVAEALAYGLPVVSTYTGAIPELVGTTAGLLVPPDELGALREALARTLNSPALLASLARGAAIVRDTLPRWPKACARMSLILESVGGPSAAMP